MITFNPDLKIYSSSKVNGDSYFTGFGTKDLGDGRNAENISNFLNKNNIGSKRIVCMEQIHGDAIGVISSEKLHTDGEKIERLDGLITKDANVALAVITADCVPLLFADKRSGVIGTSHQGWKGLLRKLPVKMVKKMQETGAKKEDIVVAIGPAIGACCYEIGEGRYLQFREKLGKHADLVFQIRGGKKYLDMTFLTYLFLTEAGIRKENIDYFPFCTHCQYERFFSFRKIKKDDFERNFSFIVKNQ